MLCFVFIFNVESCRESCRWSCDSVKPTSGTVLPFSFGVSSFSSTMEGFEGQSIQTLSEELP